MAHVALIAALVLQQQALHTPEPALFLPDTASLRHANGRTPPLMTAVRATTGSPRIDGLLDDPVWAQATPVSGFTQGAPRDGDPPTVRTEVRILYDAQAIYVGARMFDPEPARVVGHLGRRDDMANSDAFEVDFDSYHDHRTSFQFYVNPMGVRADQVASNDFSGGDGGWDPVLDAAARRDSLGWTAELRIPLSQLRYPNTPTQVWGVNFWRQIQRTGELDMWAYKSRTDQGYASFFGHLLGLEGLPQPRRLEVLPYAAGIEERIDPGAADNPFNDGSREVGRVGVDLKYGLTSNLTLDATVNPDFGQVEADPAEVNLTAYETFFSERRPFFVEGASIFSGISPGLVPVDGPQYFYSRRIGRAPQLQAEYRGDDAFADVPTSTTILGAAKLTGRTAAGWSLGAIEAVTAREYGTVDSAGIRFRDEVEPLTNYAVVRGKREYGRGAGYLGFTGTAVNRRLDGARLEGLRSAAYAAGLDLGHRFHRGRYSFFAALGFSRIQGDTLAIQAAQRSSARYYQRPDRGYAAYDPTRTSLTGWNAALGFSKDQGAWTFGVATRATSPGWEINDLGYQTRADRTLLAVSVNRRWTRPGRVFLDASAGTFVQLNWNFGGDRTTTSVQMAAAGTFRNYWYVSAVLTRTARVVNDGLLRGGPAGLTPAGWTGGVYVSTDWRTPATFLVNVQGGVTETGGWNVRIGPYFIWRPSSTVALSTDPAYSVSMSTEQYVAALPDASATATFGRRYVFAGILQHSLDLTTRVDVTLTPALSVQLYAQPFVATGAYRDFRSLAKPRTLDYMPFNADSAGVAGLDFNVRSLRGNAVVRWEYRPGSTLFFVWTTSCSAYAPSARFDALRDVGRLCPGRADHVFAVKVNYWMSV